MSYKISKELFEAVIERNDIEIFRLFKNEITFVFKDDWLQNNIKYNDFFFKCKEWALNEGYWLMTWKHKIGAGCKIFRGHLNIRVDERLDADSEQQAVFDACMYILDKDKQ